MPIKVKLENKDNEIQKLKGLDMKDGKSYANFSSDDLIKLLGKDDKKK